VGQSSFAEGICMMNDKILDCPHNIKKIFDGIENKLIVRNIPDDFVIVDRPESTLALIRHEFTNYDDLLGQIKAWSKLDLCKFCPVLLYDVSNGAPCPHQYAVYSRIRAAADFIAMGICDTIVLCGKQ